MERFTLIAVFALVTGALLAGCQAESQNSFAKMNRTDQEKLMKGDDKKTAEMMAKMAAQYGHPDSPSMPKAAHGR